MNPISGEPLQIQSENKEGASKEMAVIKMEPEPESWWSWLKNICCCCCPQTSNKPCEVPGPKTPEPTPECPVQATTDIPEMKPETQQECHIEIPEPQEEENKSIETAWRQKLMFWKTSKKPSEVDIFKTSSSETGWETMSSIKIPEPQEEENKRKTSSWWQKNIFWEPKTSKKTPEAERSKTSSSETGWETMSSIKTFTSTPRVKPEKQQECHIEIPEPQEEIERKNTFFVPWWRKLMFWRTSTSTPQVKPEKQQECHIEIPKPQEEENERKKTSWWRKLMFWRIPKPQKEENKSNRRSWWRKCLFCKPKTSKKAPEAETSKTSSSETGWETMSSIKMEKPFNVKEEPMTKKRKKSAILRRWKKAKECCYKVRVKRRPLKKKLRKLKASSNPTAKDQLRSLQLKLKLQLKLDK